jgi:hypothetical protein
MIVAINDAGYMHIAWLGGDGLVHMQANHFDDVWEDYDPWNTFEEARMFFRDFDDIIIHDDGEP